MLGIERVRFARVPRRSSTRLKPHARVSSAAFQNALVNLDIEENYKKALNDIGYNLVRLRSTYSRFTVRCAIRM